MLVKWNKVCLKVIPDPKTNETFTLASGYNEIPNDVWERVRASVEPSLKNKDLEECFVRMDKEIIPASGKQKEKVRDIVVEAMDLKDLPPKEAQAIIEDTFNYHLLLRWKDEEPRDSVRAALMKQLEKIQSYNPRKQQTAKVD